MSFILFVLFFSSILNHYWNGCNTDHMYKIFYISFIIHLIWTSKNDTNETVLLPVVSDYVQSSFVLFVASPQAYDYGVTYFRWTSFILSITFSKNIQRFRRYNSKEVSLFFVLERNLFLRLDWFYFWST